MSSVANHPLDSMPVSISKKIGTSVNYSVNGEFKAHGKIMGVRWSGSIIVERVKGKPTGNEYKGIQFLIKPDSGKQFWTKTLSSEIKVPKPSIKQC